MITKIKQLQQESKILELDNKQRKALAQQVELYITDFYQDQKKNIIYQPDLVSSNVYDEFSVKESALSIDEILKIIKNYIVKPGIHNTSSGFLGYIPGGNLYPSALGDYISDVTNLFSGIFYLSPGAVRLDNVLIRWMGHLVGYSNKAGGNLSSGGSIANFMAIVMAREAGDFRSKDFNRLVIYTTSQVHHSILKGLRIAGLKEAVIRFVPVDENFCLKTTDLNRMILQDKSRKLIPWLIVASLGTTNTGSVDPIDAISLIAQHFNLWLHIDAAYGGFFLISPKIKKQFNELHEIDSITIDPHKGLFIPYGLGAILAKSKDFLMKAYDYEKIDYIANLHEKYQEVSPASLSPELSAPFRGLRMWLPLKLFGLKPFRAALEEKLLLAQYFYQEVLKVNQIEVACEPQLSIVAFRYLPKVGDANKFNKALADKIKTKGKVFFSTTFLHDQIYLRMACLNYRTHLETVVQAISTLHETILELNEE